MEVETVVAVSKSTLVEHWLDAAEVTNMYKAGAIEVLELEKKICGSKVIPRLRTGVYKR